MCIGAGIAAGLSQAWWFLGFLHSPDLSHSLCKVTLQSGEDVFTTAVNALHDLYLAKVGVEDPKPKTVEIIVPVK